MSSALRGSQVPTHRLVPPRDFSRGSEAVEIAKIAGLNLDPFQALLLEDGLGVGSDRRGRERWAAREVAIELSRQNGKSAVIEARILAGLYLFGERTIVYTAHKGEAVMRFFTRIADLISGTPELKAELKPRSGIREANGQQAIELANKQIVLFRTRTGQGGRSLTCDCLFIDEVQSCTDEHLAALMPLVLAVPNAQIWYAGSAGGKASRVEGKLIRSMEAGSARLAMHRYAAEETDDPGSPVTWAKVNPALNLAAGVERITLAALQTAYDRLPAAKFGREHLGIGDYPREEGEEWVIPKPAWEDCEDADSKPVGSLVIAVDVKPDQSRSSVAIAGLRADRTRHGEVVANDIGTRWVAPLVAKIRAENDVLSVILDPRSQAGALLGDFADLGIPVHQATAAEFVQACGWLFAAATADPPMFHHTGGTVLTQALAQAFVRELGDAWAWSRKGDEDMSPLIAVTLAVYGLTIIRPPTAPAPDPIPVLTTGVTSDLMSAGF